ncbi:MAG: protein kinase [Deltaproteobacteria bacterium]|nr:protein kinase [Deltaproteobacteria bacterium]
MGFCDTCGLDYPASHTFCPLDGSTLHEKDDDFLGRVIAAKYRVVALIGEGGMGQVYRAQHVHMSRQVAIKVLLKELSEQPVLRERFVREAQAANMVRHDNIVEVFELGETREGIYYLVMELLEGQTLGRSIASGAMSVERAVPVLRQICSALGPSHAIGIIHRDLKPDNVFLIDRDGTDFVKILDFGVAHLVHEPRLTSKGLVLGTPEYMSPEAIKGQKPSASADLYSLGCIAYAAIAGHPPFQGGLPVEIMMRQVQDQPTALGDHVEGVAPEFARIVGRLLEKDPAERHADAYGVIRDLDAFMPPVQRPSQDPGSSARSSGGLVKRIEVPQIPDMPSGILDSWKDLTEKSRKSQDREHRHIVYEMEELTGQLDSLANMMGQITGVMDISEGRRRETGRRIRSAIDELANDASMKRQSLMKERSELDDSHARVEELDREIGDAIDQLASTRPGDASGIDEATLRTCIHLGDLASRRQQRSARTGEIGMEDQSVTEQIEDIEYQIRELKKRVEAVYEETDQHLTEQQRNLESLETERAAVESKLCNLSSQLGES